MRFKLRLPRVLALFVAASTTSPLAAQATITPPKLLSAQCEMVKPGMGAAHDQHEEKWTRAIEAIKGTPTTALAVQSVTGPQVTCWLISASSYDDMGKQNSAMMADAAYAKAVPMLASQDAQYISDVRSYIALLRPDLTGGEMPNVLTRRAMMWSEWRIRPGQDAAFANAVKAYRAAMDRGGVKQDFRVYQIAQGAPDPTFWVFSGRTSMSGFDADLADDPKIVGAMTADDKKLFDDFFAKAVISVTTNLWSYAPAQSALTAEQRASDPFWKRNVQKVAARP